MEESLVLPLPPSVNKAWIVSRNGILVHTSEYRNYLESASWQVLAYCRKNGITPISTYTPLYLYFYLHSPKSDSHNFKKVLFDALEKGGMFANDRYLMDRTMKVEIDRNNPRVELSLVPLELPGEGDSV